MIFGIRLSMEKHLLIFKIIAKKGKLSADDIEIIKKMQNDYSKMH